MTREKADEMLMELSAPDRAMVPCYGRADVYTKPGVYIFRATEGPGRVKIGKTATTWRARLKSIQAASPVILELHRFIPMTSDARRDWLERALHRQLAAHRLHGEWFAAEAMAEVDRREDRRLIEWLIAEQPPSAGSNLGAK